MRLIAGVFTLLVALASAENSARGGPVNFFAAQNAFPTNFYSLDPATGSGGVLGTTGFALGLDFSPSGILYGASANLFTINPASGATSNIGALAASMDSIAFNSSGELYGVNVAGTTLYKIDPANGNTISNITLTGTAASEINGIDFSPSGMLYGIGFGLYTINPATGAATRITPVGTDIASPSSFADMDFGWDGMIRAVTYDPAALNSKLHTIDPLTGLSTTFASTQLNLHGLASIPIPEPSSVVLAALGLVSLTLIGRRRCIARRRS